MSLRIRTVNIGTSSLASAGPAQPEPCFLGESRVAILLPNWEYSLWNTTTHRIVHGRLPESDEDYPFQPTTEGTWMRHISEDKVVYYVRKANGLRVFDVVSGVLLQHIEGGVLAASVHSLAMIAISYSAEQQRGLVVYQGIERDGVHFRGFSLKSGVDKKEEVMKIATIFDLVHVEDNTFLLGNRSSEQVYELWQCGEKQKVRILVSNKARYQIRDYGWLQPHTLILSYFCSQKMRTGLMLVYLPTDRPAISEQLNINAKDIQLIDLTQPLLDILARKSTEHPEPPDTEEIPVPENFILEPSLALLAIPLYLSNRGLSVFTFYLTKLGGREWAIDSTSLVRIPGQTPGKPYASPTGRSIVYLHRDATTGTLSAVSVCPVVSNSKLVYAWLLDQSKLSDNDKLFQEFINFMDK